MGDASFLGMVPEFVFAAGFAVAALSSAFFLERRPDASSRPGRVRFLVFLTAATAALVVGGAAASAFQASAAEATFQLLSGVALVACVAAARATLVDRVDPAGGRDLKAANVELIRRLAAGDRDLEESEQARRTLEDVVFDKTRVLAETTRRFETALHGSGVAMFQQDVELRYTWVYNASPEFGDMVGRTDDEVLPAETLAQVAPLKRHVLATGEAAEREISIRTEEGLRWLKLRVEPLDYAKAIGLTSVAVDVTSAKENDRHLRAVLRELTHRSRNLLAVIQGIARRTASYEQNLDGFLERFGGRLQALAAAHDVLIDRAWVGASMRELLEVQLAQMGEAGASQVTVQGQPLMLKPDAAQHLSLALHELAANAVEHGALSVPGGHVRVGWSRSKSDPARVEIIWRESGGPPVSAPSRTGFGRVVLERLAPTGVDGEAELDFEPAGLVWAMRFPISNAVPDARESMPARRPIQGVMQ